MAIKLSDGPLAGQLTTGGIDTTGASYILTGPFTRSIYAIMIYTEDPETKKWDWFPYKMYKNTKSKTYKRAKRHVLSLRLHYSQRFRIEEIWESVPLEEMLKIYDEENQVEETQAG